MMFVQFNYFRPLSPLLEKIQWFLPKHSISYDIPAWISTQLADLHLSHGLIYTPVQRLFKASREHGGAKLETDQWEAKAGWTCPT